MSTNQMGANLSYKNCGFGNLELDKLSTKHIEMLEIQNKLHFYRKRTKNIFIKLCFTIAIFSIRLIMFFEINSMPN